MIGHQFGQQHAFILSSVDLALIPLMFKLFKIKRKENLLKFDFVANLLLRLSRPKHAVTCLGSRLIALHRLHTFSLLLLPFL